MKFKPYEEYKKVDLPWIDEIPSHWEISRGKNIFKKEKRKVLDNYEVITCFRDGEVTLRKNRRSTGFTESLKEIGYQGIKKGDLVIHEMDAFAGAVGVSDSDGKGSPVYSVCNGKISINNSYYAFVIREMARNGYIQSLSRGIRKRSTDFRFKTFSEQLYFIPPKEEQDKIADFLDYNLAKIDRFVELTERQIELLKEQKEVIINDAVTKGIDKDVAYKDSGIDWIGEIPEHWEVTRLKYILKNQIEKDRVLKDNQVYIGLANIESKTGNIIGIDNDIKIQSDSPKFKEGDILFGKLRPYLSKVAIARNDGLCSGEILVLRKRTSIVFKKYIFYRLLSYNFISIVNSSTYGSKMPRAEWSFIGSLKITIPPKKEQEEIVAYIEKETNKIDRQIELYKRQIELIKEYRTSLIASAVTGKIDVREF